MAIENEIVREMEKLTYSYGFCEEMDDIFTLMLEKAGEIAEEEPELPIMDVVGRYIEPHYQNGFYSYYTNECMARLAVWFYENTGFFYECLELISEWGLNLKNLSDKPHIIELMVIHEALDRKLYDYCTAYDLDYYDGTISDLLESVRENIDNGDN